MAKLNFEIVTVDGVSSVDEVDVVVAEGVLGQMAILPSHAPLVTILELGELMTCNGTSETHLCISGGFMEVSDNNVTILADTAERADSIDIERAEAAKKRAQERLDARESHVNIARSEAALRRALIRLKVVQNI